MEECINGPEQKRKREAEKYNPPTQKEAWIADLAGCRLYVKPSFFTGWLATPAPGTKIDILGKVKGQFGFSFYLIEYTVPENQVMKGYVADAYVTTEKPKKPYMGGVCSHICMGLPFF